MIALVRPKGWEWESYPRRTQGPRSPARAGAVAAEAERGKGQRLAGTQMVS